MAKLKKEDLNQLSNEDLKQRLHDDSERLMKLRFNHAVNPLDNPIQLRYIRREIARIKTEIRKREMASAK
jgi:large subunit ribosomal protein L29